MKLTSAALLLLALSADVMPRCGPRPQRHLPPPPPPPGEVSPAPRDAPPPPPDPPPPPPT